MTPEKAKGQSWSGDDGQIELNEQNLESAQSDDNS